MKKLSKSKGVIASKISTILALGALSFPAYAQQVIKTESPRGLIEKCSIFPEIDGGQYSNGDHEKEIEFCAINFYNDTVGLCPKTSSTSAGILFYKISAPMTSSHYESQMCSQDGPDKIAKFKFTVNQPDTSATNSKSSIMYYHFSRYFDTRVKVPVAVKRTLDAPTINSRVAMKAHGQSNMSRAAWAYLQANLTSNQSERNIPDLFEATGIAYGVILKSKGERYGTEMNGVRSAWGDSQNYDFQKTAAFSALRVGGNLSTAIQSGINAALRQPKLATDLAGTPSTFQMISWMKELTEITLMDYIFSQQDRIGNIDYEWEWAYVQDGKLKNLGVNSKFSRKKMMSAGLRPPAELAGFSPQLIQRTWLGDNDAGGKVQYANFTKKTKMLEGQRHYSALIYKKLMNLDRDLASQGSLFKYLVTYLQLPAKDLQMVVNNVHSATAIIKNSCENGLLHFDLNPTKFLQGHATEELVDCSGN